MTTFQDIFKSSFLENLASISMLDMAIALALAFLLGLFIFFIYKKSYTGIMYSRSFGITLIALSLITTLLILTVVSNVVLSLGMVGALSIVRFRTAIKEPMDIAFLFWSIAAGIVLAAGFVPLAVLGSLLIGLVLVVFAGRKSADRPYILVLHCAGDAAARAAAAFLEEAVAAHSLKSKTVSARGTELNYEVRLRQEDASFVEQLAAMEGVEEAVLVSYNGDYMG